MIIMMLPQLVLVGGTVILSSASIFNIYETYSLIKGYPQQLQSTSIPDVVSKRNKWKTTDEAVNGLSNMKKKELVELYLQCEPPDLSSDISYYNNKKGYQYQYDGYLLDNGPVLTSVTGFITNRLFGKGKPWLGKAYMKPTSNENCGEGKNRFALNISRKTPQRLDRTFDYSIGKSILPSPSLTNKSLFNKYASHCSSLSPMSLVWRGMVDELRVIELVNKEKVLLGCGYFTWSGGVYNLAPFCLVARKCNIDKVKGSEVK